MADEPQSPAGKPQAGTKRRSPWRRMLLLAVVALAAGAWWWSAPKTYRVIGRYTTIDSTLEGSTAGFVICEKAPGGCRYVMRDWTGKERWAVESFHAAGGQSLSPDGRTFATIGSAPGGIHCVLFRW